MTSVRKRALPPPVRRGGVTPFQSGGRSLDGAAGGGAAGVVGASGESALGSATGAPGIGGTAVRWVAGSGVMCVGVRSASGVSHRVNRRLQAGPGLEAQRALADED